MPILIKVQSKHIRKGIPLSSDECPIALAVKEMPNVGRIIVTKCDLYFYDQKLLKMRRFALTAEAKKFVSLVDHWLSVGPATFELEEIIEER